MLPLSILARHCDPETPTYGILVLHSTLVTRKALEIASAWTSRHPERTVDLDFLVEASMLHDIGIVRCDAPGISCYGDEPYIRHGVLGREMLEAEGLPRHALVCERHTGAGISREEVRATDLPLPDRDFLPESIEERIICTADKFYSKTPAKIWREKSVEKITRSMSKWGDEVASRWRDLREELLP